MNKQAYNTIFQGSLAYLKSQCIYVAAKCAIADHLESCPLSVKELADKAGVNEGYLYRIMRLLCSQNVFLEIDGKYFANNDASYYLRSNVEDSIRDFTILVNNPSCPYPASAKIMECMESGCVPFIEHYGMHTFDYLKEHQDIASLLDRGMHSAHTGATRAFLSKYDLSEVSVFADIGAGSGEATEGVLREYLNIKAKIFDLPHVLDRTQERLTSAGLIDRCELVSGDFFEDVPVEADLYYIRQVLHDWTDEKCITILSNIRKNCKKGSRLLVSDCVIQPKSIGGNSEFYDLIMLYIDGGYERSVPELRKLFELSGFKYVKAVETDFWFGIVEAVAV